MTNKAITLLSMLLVAFGLNAQLARVQIIHNSPDPTVDVYAGPTLLLDNFEFRTASAFIDVPAGIPIPVGVAPSTSTSAADAIFSQTVTFESGKTYVVTASGIVFNPDTPFGLIANPNGREEASNPAKVDLAILHGSTDAPAVDIAVRTGGNLVTNLSYGNYTSYLSVDPGVYYLDVKAAGTNNIVQTYKADLTGLTGQALYVFASGYLTAGAGVPFGIFAALSDGSVVELPAAPVARVQVIHNSPEPTVDVWANNDLLLNNFSFRSATPFIFVPAGVDIALAVAADTSTSPASALATFPVNLENGKTYIVTAQGIVGNATTPFTLNVNDGGHEAAAVPAKVEFAVLHGSPDAPAVDVALYNTTQNLVSNLAYNSFTGYLSVDPAVYYLDVKVAGTSTVVGTYKADLSGLAGGAAYVFASGLVTPGSTSAFGLFAALADGTVIQLPQEVPQQFARLQIIHNSPNPTVDVYVNNDKLLDDFTYQSATPFVTVPAGVALSVGVAPANSTSVNDVIATFPVTFTADQTYIVVASGLLGNATTPFTLNVNPTGRETGSDPTKVDIAVLHGSPNAPNVDVDEAFTGNVINNLAYGSYTPYLSLDPAIYDFVVRPTGSATSVASYRADLSSLAGAAAYVFASGLIDNAGTPFGLLAALPNGTVVHLPTTPYARVQVIHNSPSPVVDVYAGSARLLNDFAFRTATPFVNVPAGRNFNIGVAPGNSGSVSDVIASFPVQLTAGKAYTVFAGGIVGNAQTPFNLFVYDDALEAAPTGSVAVSVFHGSTDAPAVDVVERLSGALVSNLAYGNNTGYLTLPPAEYVLDIKAAGNDAIVASFLADLSGLAGVPLRVFASGLLGGSPAFGLFAALPDGTVVEIPATQLARLQVIHNSPSPTVDVYVNDFLLIDNFDFRTATPFIYAPAGIPLTIGVAPATSQSSGDAIATFPVTLVNGKTYVVVASGVVGSATTPFTLLVNDAGREQSEAPGLVDLSILHGAPGAPAVDIVEYFSSTPILEDLSYGTFTDYLSIAPDVLLFDVTAANQPSQVVGTYGGDFTGLSGFAGVVFASGGPTGLDDFGLYLATPDGFIFPLPSFARAQVIHNSPSPSVDVYLDEDKIIEGFEFRQATNFGLVPAGTPFTLAVAPAGSQSVNDAIYSLPVSGGLSTGKTYTIMAAGVVGNATTPFQLYVNDAARFRAQDASSVDVNLFHGAPDAPEVDITLPNGLPVFDNIAFGEFSAYISVPPAQYVLNVTPANDNSTIVQTYLADISSLGGGAATVFASGYLNPTVTQPSFGAWVALADGTTFPLPVFVNTSDLSEKLESFSVAPNPVVSDLQVRFRLSESASLRYRIQDMTGRLIQEGDWGTVNGDFNTTLQVGQLSAGMYLLEVLSEDGRMTTKFVK